MWINQVGPILVGLTGLLTALKGLRAGGNRTETTTYDRQLSQCQEELDDSRDQHHSALRHIYHLEQFIAGYGLRAPERPESMYR